MATNKPWSGSASRFDDADAYCSSCLVDMNPSGKAKIKGNCHLPVKEPNGDLNSNGVHAAAAALAGARGGVKIPASEKKAAAKKLLGYYRQLKQDPPESLKNIAS